MLACPVSRIDLDQGVRGLDVLGCFDPVEIGHFDVEQDHIDEVVAQRLVDSLLPGRGVDVESAHGEALGQRLDKHLFVVHQKNRDRHHRLLYRRAREKRGAPDPS